MSEAPPPPPETTSDPTREPAPRAKLFGLSPAAIVLLIFIIAGIFFVVTGIRIVRNFQGRVETNTQVGDHFQQLGKAMSEFHILYHSFPHADTADEVKRDTGTTLTLGGATSNQLFRQLLATGRTTSEAPFWLKTPRSPKPPDDHFTTDATALAPGECGIAYVAGLSKERDSGTPLLIAPLIPGKLLFDFEALHGMAYVLSVDGKISSYRLEKDGRLLRGDKDFFDPIFWGGKTPDIKWPE